MRLYDELLALTERAHALVVAGAWEELAGIDRLRREVVARLPAVAPAGARAALERAQAIGAQTGALLAARTDELRRELNALSHGRAAVRGYGTGAGARAAMGASRVDRAG